MPCQVRARMCGTPYFVRAIVAPILPPFAVAGAAGTSTAASASAAIDRRSGRMRGRVYDETRAAAPGRSGDGERQPEELGRGDARAELPAGQAREAAADVDRGAPAAT